MIARDGSLRSEAWKYFRESFHVLALRGRSRRAAPQRIGLVTADAAQLDDRDRCSGIWRRRSERARLCRGEGAAAHVQPPGRNWPPPPPTPGTPNPPPCVVEVLVRVEDVPVTTVTFQLAAAAHRVR